MRIYIASDFHASEKAWRKFLNAILLNIYKADVALLAGDLTGKAIVPIRRTKKGYEAKLLGVRRKARNDIALAALERDIADVGYYSFVATDEEIAAYGSDAAAQEELLHRLMNERVASWMTLATERLGEGTVPLYLIPGNDDACEIDTILNRGGYFPQNVDARVVDLPESLELIGCGWSNTTPWATPREEPEEHLELRLEALASAVRNPRRAIFMIHVPPFDSGLDTAPILDENLRPTVSAGDMLRGPVGSTAVRHIIEKYQPLLSVHGHVHESGGDRHIQDTLAVNPGSEANSGILRGYLVDINPDGIGDVARVEG